MKNISRIIFLLLLLFKGNFLYSQSLSVEDREILELQDERILGEEEKIIKYLLSINSETRVKAINALANIGDSANVSKLNFLLAGPFENYPTVKDLNACAFMLGEIQSEESRNMIELMLNNYTDTLNSTKESFINSLGRIGDEKDLEKLIQRNLSGEDLDRAIAMSLARFALRKIKNESTVKVLKNIFSDSRDTLTQRNVAFALWRTGDKKLLESAKEEIHSLTESKDPQTRMWAYNAMGKLQDKTLLMLMLGSYGAETDWRVKVNMLNSLNNFKLDSISEFTEQILTLLGDAVSNDNEHVSLTALSVLGNLYSDLDNSKNIIAKSQSKKIREELLYGLSSANISVNLKSEISNTLSLIFRDEIKKDLLKAFSKTNDYTLKGGIVKSFGNFKKGIVYKEIRDTLSSDIKKYNLKNPDTNGSLIGSSELAKLYRGFVEMLSNLGGKTDAGNQNIMRLIFTEFSGSKDPAIVAICLNALKDSIYLKYRDETISVLLFEYNELEYPKDLDVNLIFIDAMKDLHSDSTVRVLENNLKTTDYEIAKSSADALEKITGKKYEFDARPRTDFDWDFIEKIPQYNPVTIKTNKGNIKIELLPEAAPFTVMNFLKLADKNFYDGTVFHRVVPNFVIQGGDPTGTGYGGPGYSIRSEFSPLTFDRGMVGMASSGKDTEGSQFFIMHSAAPHLDGKYTIFGRVIQGMDVVDEIMAGDYIENISH